MLRCSPKYIGYLLLTLTFVAVASCDLFVSDAARIEKAKSLLEGGEYRTAIIELKKLLQDSPNHSEGRLLLGQALLAAGDALTAEKELVRARELGISADRAMIPLGHALLAQGRFEAVLEELDPSVVDQVQEKIAILMLRGDAYLGLRRLGGAEKTFRDAILLQPDALGPQVGLASVEQIRGNFKAAEDYIGAVITADPSHVAGWLAAGGLKIAQGDFAAAEAAFNHALESAASKLTVTQEFIARSGLAESQWRQGKSAEALRMVERLLQLAPGHPRARYFRALIAYGAGDYDLAAQHLQQILSAFPNFRPAQILLGAVHYAQGNLEQADMYLSSVLAADPASLQARKLLAATRLRRQKPEDAMATLVPAVAQGVGDSQTLALLGEASFQSGDADSAVLYLEKGVMADPGNQALQMDLATGYLLAGDLERAIEVLEKLPQSKEGAYRRELLLILALLRKGDTKGALRQANRLVNDRPNDPSVYNLTGSIHMVAGQLPEARQFLSQALSLQPDNPGVLLNVGRLEFREGKQDDARARFERVLEISPHNINAALALAQLAGLRGDQEQMTKWLERANAADPAAVAPKLLLIGQYVATKNLEGAATVAQRLAQEHPKSAEVLNALAIVQMAQGQHREAADTLREVVRIAPRSPNFHYNLARTQLALRNYGEAERILEQVLALDSDHLAAASTIAALEMQAGKANRALARARHLQRRENTAAAGYELEGDLFMMQQRFVEAARAYEHAASKSESAALAVKIYQARSQANMGDATTSLESWLARRPNDNAVRLALAQAYQASEQTKRAIEQYEMILKGTPDHVIALNNLAWAYHLEGDRRALTTAERAHQLQPNKGGITDTLGWLLVQRGELKRGLELLRQAAEQAPEIPEIRYHLAVALAKTGARDEARRTLTELLNSGASFKDMAKARQLLQQL